MFKSFFANAGARAGLQRGRRAWAKRQRPTSSSASATAHGFVVDGKFGELPWRLEWGPSQRPYIQGQELRVRMELGLPPDLQMLIVSKSLMEALEKQAFEQFTESNQTADGRRHARGDALAGDVPEDRDRTARRLLRSSFAGVSSLPNEGPAWLDGPLAHALERAAGTCSRPAPPFVLMTLRGRSTCGWQLRSADETDVAAALALFETAASEALRVGRPRGDAPVTWPQTASTAWQSLAPPAQEPRRRLTRADALAAPSLRRRACRAPSWRWRCGALRPGRRRSAACARRRRSRRAGSRRETPPPPCTCIAQSITWQAMFGATTLIIAISALAALLPATSIIHAAFSVSRRAMSIWQRASAMRSRVTPCSATVRAEGDALTRRAGTSARARARPGRSGACSGGCGPARGGPGRSRSRGLRRAGCCRPARARS